MAYMSFMWQGRESINYGIYLASVPSFATAPTRTEELYLNGRHGSIFKEKGLSTFDLTLNLVYKPDQSFGTRESTTRENLNTFFFVPQSEVHRNKLVFGSRGEWYEARIVSQLSFEHFYRMKTVSVTFRCQPYAMPYHVVTDDASFIPAYHPMKWVQVQYQNGTLDKTFGVADICGINNPAVGRKPKLLFSTGSALSDARGTTDTWWNALTYVVITIGTTSTFSGYCKRQFTIKMKDLCTAYGITKSINLVFDIENDDYYAVNVTKAGNYFTAQTLYDDTVGDLKPYAYGSIVPYTVTLGASGAGNTDTYHDGLLNTNTLKEFKLWHNIELKGSADTVSIEVPSTTTSTVHRAYLYYQPEARMR